jgi:hypothetical protein
MKKKQKAQLKKVGKFLKGQLSGMKKSMRRAQTGKGASTLVPTKRMRPW